MFHYIYAKFACRLESLLLAKSPAKTGRCPIIMYSKLYDVYNNTCTLYFEKVTNKYYNSEPIRALFSSI